MDKPWFGNVAIRCLPSCVRLQVTEVQIDAWRMESEGTETEWDLWVSTDFLEGFQSYFFVFFFSIIQLPLMLLCACVCIYTNTRIQIKWDFIKSMHMFIEKYPFKPSLSFIHSLCATTLNKGSIAYLFPDWSYSYKLYWI